MRDLTAEKGKIQIIQVLRMVGATVVFLEHFFLDNFAIGGGYTLKADSE